MLGFEIAVHEPCVVQRCERQEDVDQPLLRAFAPLSDDGVEVVRLDEVLYQERCAIVVAAEVVRSDQARDAHAREERELGFEETRSGMTGTHEMLEREHAFGRFAIAYTKDARRPTVTQRAEPFVSCVFHHWTSAPSASKSGT